MLTREINQKIVEEFRRQKSELAIEVSQGYDDINHFEKLMEEFVDIIIKSLEVDRLIIEEQAVAFGKKFAEVNFENVTFETGLHEFFNVRNTFWGNLKTIMLKLHVDTESALEVMELFDAVNEVIIQAFNSANLLTYRESLEEKEAEFLSLSAPVVPLLDGMAILPIVGGIDESRAERLLRNALYEASSRELDHLFIDLSGVNYIDTMIAYHIFKIVDSLSLIGVETILSGIRPEVSHTMVSLGINFTKIKTYSTMQQALTIYVNNNEPRKQ